MKKTLYYLSAAGLFIVSLSCTSLAMIELLHGEIIYFFIELFAGVLGFYCTVKLPNPND